MAIQAVLFDLDGTLLPMDQEDFTKRYFGALAMKLAPHGYDPKVVVANVWAGTKAMVKNDGSCTNEQAFWRCFAQVYGDRVYDDLPVFEDFYKNEFIVAKQACGMNPLAKQAVDCIRAKGLRVALATNPLFPAIATENRIRWAGLQPQDFELYTTYENCCYCKPNPQYYRETIGKMGLQPQDCLMVGNDVQEDMVAATIGMQVFLLTDCLLNKGNADISQYPNGNFEQLMQFIAAEV